MWRLLESPMHVRSHPYDTFKYAAFHRNLLDLDDEWEKCLDKALTFQMSYQMRQ